MTTVCVTGMHRSGTSFAANALRRLGVSLGDPDQLMPPGPDNRAGYWENRLIKELDDEILAELGGSWDQPPVLAPGWEHHGSLDELRSRAGDVLQSAFGAAIESDAPLAWKDPRLSLVLPFWRTVTPITTTVVIVRDPREVAASLHARNGMPSAQAALLWLRYLLAAMRNDPGHLLLAQAAFFEDLPATLRDLADHVGVEPPTGEAIASIGSDLDVGLRHHVAPADAVAEDPLMELAVLVWNRGRPDATNVPAAVTASLAQGWLRPPVDGDQLAEARAKVVKLEVSLQRRELAKAKLDARRAKLDARRAKLDARRAALDAQASASTPSGRDGGQD